jgi:hypothetical protein
MDRRIQLSIAVAAPVVAVGTACAWFLLRSSPAPVAMSPPAVVEHCKRAAELLYDVSWAAACSKAGIDGDSNDCTLPDAQAARVNAILAAEEARCMAAEAQASANP